MLILIFLHTMHTFTHQTIIVDQIRFTEAIKFGFYDFLTMNLYFSDTEATLESESQMSISDYSA